MRAIRKIIARGYQHFVREEPGPGKKAAGITTVNLTFHFHGLLLPGVFPDWIPVRVSGIAFGDFSPGETGQGARVPLGLGRDGKDGVLL